MKTNPDTMGDPYTCLLILDFDGVILESVEVKTEAFRELFSFAPDHVEEIVEFHRQNGGMSRYDKIRHIYAEILDEPLSEGRFSELVDRFSGLVLEGVLASPPVRGVEEFLECYSSKIPIYIVSATPEAEIREIIEAAGCVRTVVQGHYHPGADRVIEDVRYFTLRAMCEGEENAFALLDTATAQIIL